MTSLQRCADALGYRLVNLKLRKREHKYIRRQLHAAASLGNKNAAVFADKNDVAAINIWRRAKDPLHTACSLVVAHGGIIFYAGAECAYQSWHDLLSRENPLECMLCMEEKRDSRSMIRCQSCSASICDLCNHRVPGYCCPFCRQHNNASLSVKASGVDLHF